MKQAYKIIVKWEYVSKNQKLLRLRMLKCTKKNHKTIYRDEQVLAIGSVTIAKDGKLHFSQGMSNVF